MALGNPYDLLTMAHKGTILYELGCFGTSTDLRNTQRALAVERFAERSVTTELGPPGGSPAPWPWCPAGALRPSTASSASSIRWREPTCRLTLTTNLRRPIELRRRLLLR